ncbi:MAG TPA: hypothetical protein VFG24_09445 [Nitrosopumilaceae archaeon]|nr:hypothetical protein [Nitrosopumilaceae archaeon]
MKFFLPVFFLLGLSFVSAFGDTGSITVVSGKSFQINYDANYVKVLSAQPDAQDQALIFSIQVTNPTSTLELTLPRDLIDAKNKDGSDLLFIVLAGGALADSVEKSADQTSRTILIHLAADDKELEIIGTSLASSGNGGTGTIQNPTSPTQTPIPTNPVTQQTNQTSQQQTQNEQSQQNQTYVQKPTANVSPQNLSAQEILSKIFHFILPNLSFNIVDKQIIEYSVIAAAILILIVVIASSKKSKTRKQIRK